MCFVDFSRRTDQTFCGRTNLTFPFIRSPLVDSSRGVIHKKWAAATSNLGKSKSGHASTLRRQWIDSCTVWKEALQRLSERTAWCLREDWEKDSVWNRMQWSTSSGCNLICDLLIFTLTFALWLNVYLLFSLKTRSFVSHSVEAK